MHFAELLKVEFVITPVLVNGGYWAHAGGRLQSSQVQIFSADTQTHGYKVKQDNKIVLQKYQYI